MPWPLTSSCNSLPVEVGCQLGAGDKRSRHGFQPTVCQIPEAAVYQIPSGFRRCLPKGGLARIGRS